MSDLFKPCPFCGHGDSPAIEWYQSDRDAYMVTATCRSCGATAPAARAPLAETGMTAAGRKAWNTRKATP
jgi:Lar family restriction alleviation protein